MEPGGFSVMARPLAWWVLFLAVLGLSGCNENDYPRGVTYGFQPYFFRIESSNTQGKLDLDAAQAETLNAMLEKYFGTPRLLRRRGHCPGTRQSRG
jgi:hypothetical protein